MADYSRTVFAAGIICYNTNTGNKCVVLDGGKGTETDRFSFVMEWTGRFSPLFSTPSNRTLVPTGEFFDLEAFKNLLTVSDNERKAMLWNGDADNG
jgi:hypothetical protein